MYHDMFFVALVAPAHTHSHTARCLHTLTTVIIVIIEIIEITMARGMPFTKESVSE